MGHISLDIIGNAFNPMFLTIFEWIAVPCFYFYFDGQAHGVRASHICLDFMVSALNPMFLISFLSAL